MSTAVFGPGHVVAGRYRIEQLLGQGGMGSVYRAVQLSVGRTVALKLLMDEHDGSAALLERFQREALALARLTHENTVRLFDFGTSERGRPFLVMELLRGADLARDLERQGPLRYDHALQVTRQLLCSLSEAHDAGIVHRDIKPGNVFLCAASSWPRVKVLDFGIVGGVTADAAAPKLTRTGTVLGSAAYMSPEQAQGLAVGAASDLYAVGVVLFEMLTQRTLFDARPLTAQLLAKVMERAPRLRDVRPELGVPDELEALVAELVERDPSRRPASARALLERVDALLARAGLPPLSRAVASATAGAAPGPIPTLLGMPRLDPPTSPAPPAAGARGIPETEPMLALHPDRDSSAPRIAERAAPAPHRRRLRLTLGVLGAATLALALRSAPAEQVFAAALAQLAPSRPALNRAPAEAPRTIAAAAAPLAPATGEATLATIQRPELVAEASADGASRLDAVDLALPPAEAPPPERSAPPAPAKSATVTKTPRPRVASPPRKTAPATPAPSSTPVTPPEAVAAPEAAAPAQSVAAPAESRLDADRPPAPPTTLSPEPAPAPEEPLPDARRFERVRPLSSIAAVEAAYQAGELSWAERNELIATRRHLHAVARARALRAYREGRIDRRELWLRQRALDREYVGEPADARRRGRVRLMW